MLRVAVLVGGGGSNLQALIDQSSEHAKIAHVVSHVADVKALARAAEANIPTTVIPHCDFDTRMAFDRALHECLQAAQIDIVCLAGFMRILGPEIVAKWQGRMLNIHPALLPAFKGLDTHNRALQAGVAIHGCTVHLVTAELDDGPILVQAAVPVLSTDDTQALAMRVLAMEHRAYPQALDMLARAIKKGAQLTGRRLLLDPSLQVGQPTSSSPEKK